MPKKWKLNIINGTIHTGLSEILKAIAMPVEKDRFSLRILLRNG